MSSETATILNDASNDLYSWKKQLKITLQSQGLWKYTSDEGKKSLIVKRLSKQEDQIRKVAGNLKAPNNNRSFNRMQVARQQMSNCFPPDDELDAAGQITYAEESSKALAIIKKTLGPTYEPMISGHEDCKLAWETLMTKLQEHEGGNVKTIGLLAKMISTSIKPERKSSNIDSFMNEMNELYERLVDLKAEVNLQTLVMVSMIVGIKGSQWESLQRVLYQIDLNDEGAMSKIRQQIRNEKYLISLENHQSIDGFTADVEGPNESEEKKYDPPRQRPKKRAKKFCTICKQYGKHTKETCFFNVNYKGFSSIFAVRHRKNNKELAEAIGFKEPTKLTEDETESEIADVAEIELWTRKSRNTSG